MESFDFFGVALGELLSRHSDNLSMTLQSQKISAAEAQQIVSISMKILTTMRTEENFKFFWTNTIKTADE